MNRLSATLALLVILPAVRAEEPSFRNHIIPVLTKAGCNSGACHGALAGKGGLKLSLRGYDPETDFFVLTRQAGARRVDRQEPAKSLMLLKPTRKLAHGGGKRLEDDSDDYKIVLEWIAAGARGPRDDDPRLQRLEVAPAAAALKPKDTLSIKVKASYTDGHSEDVTRWTRFSSSEDLVAGVNDEGQVTVTGYGEAAINVAFGTRVAATTITSPFPNKLLPAEFAKSPRHNFVDELALKKLAALQLLP